MNYLQKHFYKKYIHIFNLTSLLFTSFQFHQILFHTWDLIIMRDVTSCGCGLIKLFVEAATWSKTAVEQGFTS